MISGAKLNIFFQDMSLKAGWDSVSEVAVGQPMKYKVEDLIPKKTYKFRIRAVNKIGSSEPGLFGKPVLAKDPWGKIEFFISTSVSLVLVNTMLK